MANLGFDGGEDGETFHLWFQPPLLQASAKAGTDDIEPFAEFAYKVASTPLLPV